MRPLSGWPLVAACVRALPLQLLLVILLLALVLVEGKVRLGLRAALQCACHSRRALSTAQMRCCTRLKTQRTPCDALTRASLHSLQKVASDGPVSALQQLLVAQQQA